MEIIRGQIEKIEKFVEARLDSLTWQHTRGIRPIAKKLAGLERADKSIVDVAVLFHDLGKVKGDDGHAARSAEATRRYLEKENFSRRFIEEIVYCVSVHDLPWQNQANLLTTPEAKVLFDADMIQQLSKFGVIRHIMYFQRDIANNFAAGLIKARDALFKAYNLIITENGRQLAEPGYKFVKDFFKDLL